MDVFHQASLAIIQKSFLELVNPNFGDPYLQGLSPFESSELFLDGKVFF